MKNPKKQKNLKIEAWAIVNPYGDFWSNKMFESEKSAKNYFNDFWGPIKFKGFKIIKVIIQEK